MVLDVGTGSGVLAIAADLLGASRVLGIDNDPDAIQSARENLTLNPGAVRTEIEVGDLTARKLPVADVVTANLTGALLVRAAALLLGAVRPRGALILACSRKSELTSARRTCQPRSPGKPRKTVGCAWSCDAEKRPVNQLYMSMHRTVSVAIALVALSVAVPARQAPLRASQQPARDTSAQQKDASPPPSGRITGRVLAADTGRPVKRARVFASSAELPGGRGALTDDGGIFDLSELPAGRYTLTVSKSGFVSLSYGRRRPLQAGTPLQLADGQQLKSVDFQLPRGSVIEGRVLDEDGDAMPGVTVRVMRYQYQQGDRRLVPAGNAQTDDRGRYRVWGLTPGDYYVSAVARNFNVGGGRGVGRGGPGGPAGPPGGGPLGGRGGVAGPTDEPITGDATNLFSGRAVSERSRTRHVGLGQELLDINFSMLLVRAARITGHVTNPDGTPTTRGT